MNSEPSPHAPLWKAVAVAVTLLLATVLLLFSLRGVDWHEVIQTVTGVDTRLMGQWAAIGTLTLGLRALRWWIILNAGGTVRFPLVFWATAAGYLGNNVLPARAGEVVRTLMISSRTGLATAFVLATALAERTADAVVLLAVASSIVVTAPAQLGWLAAALKPLGLLGLGAALLLAVLPRLESVTTSALGRSPLPHALKIQFQNTLSHAVRGIRVFHDRGRLLSFGGLTAVIWTLDALAVLTGGAALGLAIPLPAAFLLLAALGLGSALPSAPGYLGIYQFAAVVSLTPFGLSRTDAVAFILVAQALTIALMGVFGTIGLVRYSRSGADASIEDTVS